MQKYQQQKINMFRMDVHIILNCCGNNHDEFEIDRTLIKCLFLKIKAVRYGRTDVRTHERKTPPPPPTKN